MIWFSQVAQQEDWQHGKQKKLRKSHQIGFDAGTARDFCTEEDYELYDWAHNRVQYDWAKPFDNAKITSIWNLAAEIIAEGVDARSAADAAYKSAVEKATEMGLISAKE